MIRLLETIRYENHRFYHLERHIARMNRSRKALFGLEEPIDVEEIFQKEIQSLQTLQARTLEAETLEAETLEAETFETEMPETGLYKCRIIYAGEIEKTEFIPYQLPVIHSLKMVTGNDIDYSFKYLNRKPLEELYGQKGECDDILIVKNGLVTDTYFANILFFNGTKWVTPAHPLLKGTQRQYLLETNRIIMADIRPSDLKHFQKARLANAMIRFEDEMDINMENIHL